MSRGELCFCIFTVWLTLWERVFREADQRAGQRAGRLTIEVVKLLVKPLMKLYQTGPKDGINRTGTWHVCVCEKKKKKKVLRIQISKKECKDGSIQPAHSGAKTCWVACRRTRHAMSGRSFPVTTRSAILVPLATRQWSEMPPHVVPSYLCSYYELWCVDHRPIDLLCLLVLNTTWPGQKVGWRANVSRGPTDGTDGAHQSGRRRCCLGFAGGRSSHLALYRHRIRVN
jgi:hypothetical protein